MKLASELAEQCGCSVLTIYRHANKLFGKEKKGITRRFDEAQVMMLLESIKLNTQKTSEKDNEPANPNWTGIPLAVRVYQAWLSWLRSETGGYPRNHPSRPLLLRWNPYTARYGVRP